MYITRVGGVRGSFRTAPSYDYAARPSGKFRLAAIPYMIIILYGVVA